MGVSTCSLCFQARTLSHIPGCILWENWKSAWWPPELWRNCAVQIHQWCPSLNNTSRNHWLIPKDKQVEFSISQASVCVVKLNVREEYKRVLCLHDLFVMPSEPVTLSWLNSEDVHYVQNLTRAPCLGPGVSCRTECCPEPSLPRTLWGSRASGSLASLKYRYSSAGKNR